MDKIGNIAL